MVHANSLNVSSGIILKPLNGYGSNNIFYFKLKGNYLTYQNLFRDTLLINKKVNKIISKTDIT